MFPNDVLPFALIAAVVMLLTGFVTHAITNLWLLLIARVALAATLYYIIMRMTGAAILKECIAFVLHRHT